MPTQLQLRRGNTAQTATFTGAVAEITVDTDKKTIVVHDGTTSGGFALALESAQLDQFAFTKANLAFDRANSSFAQANLAYDLANTKYNSAGGTISGNVIVTGNVTPTTDNVNSLGSPSKRWKDLFVGPGSINIDGIVIGNSGGQIVISGASDFVFQSTTGAPSVSSSASANIALNSFNQANLAFNQANTSYGSFAQANLAYNQANSGSGIAVSSFAQANLAYNAANSAVTAGQANVGVAIALGQANVGAARIADVASGQANVGAARISDVASGQANVGAGLITVTSAYEANVGAARISVNANVGIAITSGQANVGDGLITVTSAYEANVGAARISVNANVGIAITSGQANVGAARIADVASGQANVGAAVISLTSAYETNVGSGLINVTSNVTSAYQANVGAARIADVASGQANVGAGLLSYQTTSQANVGSGLITVTAAYQANVGNGLITKVAKAGDVMTGDLSTSGALIGSSLSSNTVVTINTNAVYESTVVTTANAAQFTLDSFSTTTYRSAKYLVQVSSGSAYELLELTLIHDGTTVYLSQYGNIKTGATLSVFDATISTGTLSLLATPNNAVTTFKTAILVIPT